MRHASSRRGAACSHVVVEFGDRARVVCEVARTTVEQARGLQGHRGLIDGEGMLFPFAPPREAVFHMGKVAFPIDLVFTDGGGRVARIVHEATPGAADRWRHPITSAVVEVPGGFCRRAGISVGNAVQVLGRPITGAQTYNLLRTLTEASAPLEDGYYGKEPAHEAPDFGGERDTLQPGDDRFKDRLLPDEGHPNAMDQPEHDWESNMGYVRMQEWEGAPVRSAARRAYELEIDPAELAAAVVEAGDRAGVRWEEVALNDRIERAIVEPRTVGEWLHELGLEEHERDTAHDAVTSAEGMEAVAQGFLAAGLADTAQVVPVGDENVLVLTRGRT